MVEVMENCTSNGNENVDGTSEWNHLYVTPVCSAIGLRIHQGQSQDQGVDEGSQALRDSGLGAVVSYLGLKYEDCGDIHEDYEETALLCNSNGSSGHSVTVKQRPDLDSSVRGSTAIGYICHNACKCITKLAKEKKFVLSLGGDHSIATGTITGMLDAYPDLMVIWIDAHGDANIPETSYSGNYHGMSAAHTMGLFNRQLCGFQWMDSMSRLPVDRIVYVGLRDVDDGEKEILNKNNIKYYSTYDIVRDGIADVMEKAIKFVNRKGVCPIHVSLDIDAVDPLYAPGTGTTCHGGLTRREIIYMCRRLEKTKQIVSMDMVELNPNLDIQCSSRIGGNLPINKNATVTAKLCLELIAEILGSKRI